MGPIDLHHDLAVLEGSPSRRNFHIRQLADEIEHNNGLGTDLEGDWLVPSFGIEIQFQKCHFEFVE
jgi:hypothetical protein